MDEAAARLAKSGPNALTEKKATPMWVKFIKQFTGFLPILLEIGGLLCILV